MKPSRPKARILFTVQSVAGLALLALAVPYSGCLTSYMWNQETVLIASRREGRVEFKGDLADRLVNAEGDTAYPGTMEFCSEEREAYKQTGWLVVPAAYHGDWRQRIKQNRHFITAARCSDGVAMTVVTNPRPSYQLIDLGYRPTPFPQATEFPFHWVGDASFHPDKSGYKRVNTAVLGGVGDLDEALRRIVICDGPDNILGFERNGPVAEANTLTRPDGLNITGVPTTEYNTGFSLVFNPLKRTGTTDFFNTTSKVVLTLPAVAGDVATTAVFAGGVVVAGGVMIVTAPFVAAGEAIGKAFKEKPEKPPVEKCEEKPEPAKKSSDDRPEPGPGGH